MPARILFWPWTSGVAAEETLERLRASAPPDASVVVAAEAIPFSRAVNDVLRDAGDADVAVVADAVELPGGWLERLALAAEAEDTISAATALVLDLDKPRIGPTAIHPRVLVPEPACGYLRRRTLELVGPLDESLTHPDAALAELSARAVSRGLWCVVADDVHAWRRDGGLPPCPSEELDAVDRLHPWLAEARAEEDALEVGPLRRSLILARSAERPLTVTIDARALGAGAGGTQTHQEGLVRALAGSGRLEVRVLVRDDAAEELVDALSAEGVGVVRETDAAGDLPRTDVAHRPQQAFVPEDLGLLRSLGERIVISHLDLIAFRDPAYHSSPSEWRRFRRLTRLALGAADRVVFNSEHARDDAVAEELIEPGYTAVVGLGVEAPAPDAPRRRPEALPPDRELVVMIGSDYLHKNRLFALELFRELRDRHRWDGLLVLAGAHVAHGGSAAEEADVLGEDPELAAHVIDLGPVDEAEKAWLLDRSAAVLSPSVYEGFGLTPLEAAAAGTACIYAATTSLVEVVGAEAATIVPWDPAASADRAIAMLREGAERERHLRSLRTSLDRRRWDAVAAQLADVYRAALASPYRSSVPRAWEELAREQLILDYGRAYDDLRERVDHGLPLIDRGGLLTREQQRGLMRIAARGWLRGPLLGPIGMLGGMRPESDDDPAASQT